ncbi:pyridoxamine 5'-phosphate oxidase family protein [Aeromicrobium sp. CF4.19]|uniref:pyridoxamine 5'-phosphate oxidase family protein n=1 Tax=Aeromicrobium sp. CF4.19 TaxID=3373082 RepID=UPI003EE5D2BF
MPSQADHHDGLHELDGVECRELLGTTTVGRVAFVDDSGQQLLPLNFVVKDDVVYFRTSEHGPLANLVDAPDVAFEVDHHGTVSRDGWSVVVKGSAATVQDPAVREEVLADPRLRPWAGGERELLIALTPRTIQGRRVHDR